MTRSASEPILILPAARATLPHDSRQPTTRAAPIPTAPGRPVRADPGRLRLVQRAAPAGATGHHPTRVAGPGPVVQRPAPGPDRAGAPRPGRHAASPGGTADLRLARHAR